MAQPVQVSMHELNAKIGELLMECIKRAEREDALLAHIAELQATPAPETPVQTKRKRKAK